MARRKKLAITSAASEILAWPELRIMGIDPSISSTGWSVVYFRPRQRPRLLAHGTIKTDPPGEGLKTNMKNIIERSKLIFTAVRAVCEMWGTELATIEVPIPARMRGDGGHMGPGSQSGSIAVAAVYNAVPLPAEQIPLLDANRIKMLVAGHGRADKQAVKSAVTDWLSFLPRTNTDVSDSIAGAIAYALDHLTEQPTQDELEWLIR